MAVLGFTPSEMYNDDDVETAKDLRGWIGELGGLETPIEHFCLLYLTLIAPGGCIEDAQRQELQSVLKDNSPGVYWERLELVGGLLKGFGESEPLDSGETIKQILEILRGYEPTWIGTDISRFPSSGFFVGKNFTEADVPELLAQRPS